MTLDLAGILADPAISKGGRSPVLAAPREPRCSYCVFSPAPGQRDFRALLVYVHGQGRRFQYLLNALRPMARALGLVVVCPLFPGNVTGDGNLEGYKYLREGDVRYDEVLLAIVAEVQASFSFDESRFFLGGFSGGGQFAHRFAMLHGRQLRAVSVAAPGSVTLLREDLPWWVGTGPAEDAPGTVDVESMRDVDVHLVVGSEDLAVAEARFEPSSRYWLPDANVAGTTRVERLHALHRSLEAAGVRATLDVVPAVGHQFPLLLPSIGAFFARTLGFPGAQGPVAL